MPGRSLVNKCWRSRFEGSSPLDRNAFNVPIFSSRRDRSLFRGQRSTEDGECLAEIPFRQNQRGEETDDVAVDAAFDDEQATFARPVDDALGSIRIPLLAIAIGYE